MVNHEPRHRPSLSAKGGRGGRKSESSECEASINQNNPSFKYRDRGTNADDAVQRQSSTCHRRAAMGCHGSNVSVKNKLIGPSTSVVFGSRRSAWMSGVICTREATHGDVHAGGGARDPSSESHASRREEDVQAVCLRHHKSDARLARATQP